MRRNRRVRAIVRYRKEGFQLLTVQTHEDGQHVNVASVALLEIDGIWHQDPNPDHNPHHNSQSAGATRTGNYDALTKEH